MGQKVNDNQEQMTGMKRCPKCGTLHDDTVVVCGKCFYNFEDSDVFDHKNIHPKTEITDNHPIKHSDEIVSNISFESYTYHNFENVDDKPQLKDKQTSLNPTTLKNILLGVIAVLGIVIILCLAYILISSFLSRQTSAEPIIEKDTIVIEKQIPLQHVCQELELTPSEVSEAFDFSEEAQIDFNADPENAIYEDIYDILGQGCSFYCVCSRGKLKASSTLAPQGRMNYYVQNIHDLRYNTAWVEGHPDYGIDEWVEYTLPANNPPIEQIIIVNGYVRTKKSWTENSRVRTLELSVDGKKFATIHLSDLYASQTFDVGEIKPHDKPLVLRFTIKDVYPGTKYKDTAITEIYFNGSAH